MHPDSYWQYLTVLEMFTIVERLLHNVCLLYVIGRPVLDL